MRNAIRREIKKLSARALDRKRSANEKIAEYAAKYSKRTGRPSTPTLQSSHTFQHPHKHFDPKYCKRNANFLAKTIWHKITTGQYEPQPALMFELDKPGGGKREVMQFAIPDAAVANVLNTRIVARNLKRQSANSYAYRPDRNLFDALLKLRSSIRKQRNFVLQLDFEKYFDSIPHPYLYYLINDNDLLATTGVERSAIYKFLKHKFANAANYRNSKFKVRQKGTPQGSSISLVLANLASHPLDFELEAVNGQFVRYADDTVVISYSYEDAIRSYDIFNLHCLKSGLKINRSKSPGIWILSNEEEELRSMSDFKFLGYGVSVSGLRMHSTVGMRLRVKLSRLINLYLIQYIKKTPPLAQRAGTGFDWDLLGLIAEIRMSLYGGYSEQQLANFVKRGEKLSSLKGLMGFYALLDDKEALVRLDGWLATTITMALTKRYSLLRLKLRISKSELISGSWYDAQSFNNPNFTPEARLPSFVRGWTASRKHQAIFGLENVEPPNYLAYY